MAEIKLMGGCHTDGDIFDVPLWGFAGGAADHCQSRKPVNPCAVTVDFDCHVSPIRIREANIDNMPRDAVMYGSTVIQQYGRSNYTSPTGASSQSSANCGKVVIANAGGFVDTYVIFDYVPNGLSYGLMLSDTWFSYLYTSGCNGGHVGTACYKYETENKATSAGTDPNTGLGTAGSTDSGGRCIPCPDFSCTLDRLTIDYTADEVDGDQTGDPDCPFPTLFAIDSLSNKLVFSYDQFSTTLPNGVKDFNFVYSNDGIDTPAWSSANFGAGPTITTQTGWQTTDAGFNTFLVIEGNDVESGNAQGLRLTVRVSAVQDLSVLPTVSFTGTKWEILELVEPGQGYNVNDVFTLEYDHIHADNTVTKFTVDIKITQVGPIQVTQNNGGDILRSGDTINGHVITKMFHTDLDNFNYHIAYLDGNGAEFTGGQGYTSSRNHQITALAGFGAKNRAWYGGLYEFTQKSFQYTTHLRDSAAPNVFDTCKQPVFDYGCRVTMNPDSTQIQVVNSSDASKFEIGHTVKGPLFHPGTYVTARSGNTVTLNQPVNLNPISYDEEGNSIGQPYDLSETDYSSYETDAQVQTLKIENGKLVSMQIVDGGAGLDQVIDIVNKPLTLKTVVNRPDATPREFLGTQLIPSDPPEYLTHVEGYRDVEGFVEETEAVKKFNKAYGVRKYVKVPKNQDNRPVIPEVSGTFTNGVLTGIEIVDPGRGLSNGDDIVFTVPDLRKEVESVVIPGSEDSKPQWAGSIEQSIRDADTEYTAADGSEKKLGDEIVDKKRRMFQEYGLDPDFVNNIQEERVGGDFRQYIRQDPSEQLKDPELQRRIQLPQGRYSKNVVDTLRESLREKKPTDPAELAKELGKIGASEVWQRNYQSHYDAQTTSVENALDNLQQEIIPEYAIYKENLISTTQERFGDLPHATDLVKYHMSQYRPDERQKATVEVTLKGFVVESGCSHVPCAGTPTTPSSSPAETDPETGATTTYTYTLSPVLGPGCTNWSASGTQQIFHDLTRSAQLWAQTVASYGNPFDITE